MKLKKIKRPSEETIRKLKRLGPDFKGKIAAIEPKTERSFLGETVLEAFHHARKVFPKSLFYFVRIGYPAVDFHKGGLKKR